MPKELDSIVSLMAIWKLKNGKADEDLAKALGVSRNTLGRKRRGEADFRMNEIVKLCELFECSPNELMGY